MNKEELIERIEGLKNIFGNKAEYIEIDAAIELISKLDEPHKVQIPQFVADWIEVCKEHLTPSLYTAMNPNFMKEYNQSFDFILWIKKTSNQQIFARAWLDGYKVEKEKRYLVKVKGVSGYGRYLNKALSSNEYFLHQITKSEAIEPNSPAKNLKKLGSAKYSIVQGYRLRR